MNQVFLIGVYPGLTLPKLDYVIDVFKGFAGMRQRRSRSGGEKNVPFGRSRPCSRTYPVRCATNCGGCGKIFITGGTGIHTVAGCWRVSPGPTSAWALGAEAVGVDPQPPKPFTRKLASFGQPPGHSFPEIGRDSKGLRLSVRPVFARHSRRDRSQRQAQRRATRT